MTKLNLRKTLLYSLFIYCRYIYSRFLKKAQISNFSIHPKAIIEKLDEGINFFGYYNISPSNKNKDIVYLKVQNEFIRGSLWEPASIMLQKNNSKEKFELAQTKAWNWQQGCMLQWHPENQEYILFNDYDETKDKYIAKILNTEGNIIKQYDNPVYNISKCGKFALTLNYDRLAVIRPDYGYFNKKDYSLPDDLNDGIWHIDLESGDFKLIISLEHLKHLSWSPTMKGAMHKVNHIDINPSGNRFMFLHRWKGPKGRFMRLITSNRDGTELFVLNGDIMTSHCCWLNDKEILSYCEYQKKRGYFKFYDQSDEVNYFSNKMPKIDGHPSISPLGNWVITDTYRNKKTRMTYLYLYNISENRIIKLARFFHPFKYKGEIRVDLHPKWSPDGKSIFVESGHTGRRQLYKIDITKIIAN